MIESDGGRIFLSGLLFLLLLGLVVFDHEASEHSHHHLGFHFDDVFGQSVHPAPDFPRHGDRVLGVVQLLLQYKTTTINDSGYNFA
jgi:hypothetical protein